MTSPTAPLGTARRRHHAVGSEHREAIAVHDDRASPSMTHDRMGKASIATAAASQRLIGTRC
jgi:hypothetical protein